MAPKALYVIARGNNGRPVCQHKVPDGVASLTACGADIGRWSREFTTHRFESILCKRNACRA
jgi:hypothetical protein